DVLPFLFLVVGKASEQNVEREGPHFLVRVLHEPEGDARQQPILPVHDAVVVPPAAQFGDGDDLGDVDPLTGDTREQKEATRDAAEEALPPHGQESWGKHPGIVAQKTFTSTRSRISSRRDLSWASIARSLPRTRSIRMLPR